MEFKDYFPVFDKLTAEEKTILENSAVLKLIKAGTVIHDGAGDCLGLLVIRSGRLRAFITSDEGREITVYRLFERDICLFSASCIMKSIQFDITISAEKDTEAWLIPADTYKNIMERSAVIANYTREIMSTRFTDVMWLIEQVMWKSFDKRLAGFLLEESALEDTETLTITHEQIAAHLGTAREVVTRMLKYFRGEGAVELTRGTIRISDREKLERLSQ